MPDLIHDWLPAAAGVLSFLFAILTVSLGRWPHPAGTAEARTPAVPAPSSSRVHSSAQGVWLPRDTAINRAAPCPAAPTAADGGPAGGALFESSIPLAGGAP